MSDLLQEISLLKVFFYVKILINIIEVVVPLIIMAMVFKKMFNAIVEGKMTSEIIRDVVERTVAAFIIFLAPSTIIYALNLVPGFDKKGYTYYYENATREKINEKEKELKVLKEEEKKKEQEKLKEDFNKRNENDKKVNQSVREYLSKVKKEQEQNGSIDTGVNTEPVSDVEASVDVGDDTLEIHFIASGYYDDAILIRSKDTTLFIDGGRYNGSKRELPYLESVGVSNIDILIGSHIQNDHIAAQAALLDKYNVKQVLYPDNIFDCVSRNTCEKVDQEHIVDALNKHNIKPNIVSPGSKVTFGNIELYFLAPVTYTNVINNNSFIFILKFGDKKMMFTGDAGGGEFNLKTISPAAQELGISLDVDILKYPHHGNATIKDEILNSVTPEYIIVPNYNASKYPSSANISKIQKYGKMYRQSDSSNGNLLITIQNNQIIIK